MKKNVLAFAVMGTFAGVAFAQSSVGVYGIVDTGLVYSKAAAGSTLGLSSGVASSSRIGFKGTEDLGSGLSAHFALETGFSADNGELDNKSSVLFNRLAVVGLSSKTAGGVTFGRQYTPIYSTLLIADPFGNNYGGAVGRVMADETGGVRMNNSVIYSSPTVAGFSGQVAYGFGEVPGDTEKSRQVGFAAGYANGPLTVRLGYNKTNNAAATDSGKNTVLVGKYNFGVATASLGFGVNKGIGTKGAGTDSRDLLVGVTVPFGKSTILASYIRKDDRNATTDYDTNQYAIGYNYSLSKRTTLYTAFSKLSNTNFTTTKFGKGDREFDIGIRHSF